MLSEIRKFMRRYRRRRWYPLPPEFRVFLKAAMEVYGTQTVADYYAVDPGTVWRAVQDRGKFPGASFQIEVSAMQDFQWIPPLNAETPGRTPRNPYLQRMARRMGLETSLPWTRPTVRLFELANDLKFEGWDLDTGFLVGEAPGVSSGEYRETWQDLRAAGLPVTVIRHFTGMRSPRDLGNAYPSWSEFLLANLLRFEVTQLSPGSYSG